MIPNLETKLLHIFSVIKEKPSEQIVFHKFLEIFSDEWKQLKINFAKFNRSKQVGKSIPLPKPEVFLKKEIRVLLKKASQ